VLNKRNSNFKCRFVCENKIYINWFIRLSVRTQDFHSWNGISISQTKLFKVLQWIQNEDIYVIWSRMWWLG